MVIPAIDTRSGDSLGINSQLRIAPKTGIINFHMFRAETFTPSRCKSKNQIEYAAADTKPSQIIDE